MLNSTQTLVERYIQLHGCRIVDEIVPYTTEKDLEDILKLYNTDVRIIGVEYKDREFTGKAFCDEKGIKLFYNERKHRFSSTTLRKDFDKRECSKVQHGVDSNTIHP